MRKVASATRLMPHGRDPEKLNRKIDALLAQISKQKAEISNLKEERRATQKREKLREKRALDELTQSKCTTEEKRGPGRPPKKIHLAETTSIGQKSDHVVERSYSAPCGYRSPVPFNLVGNPTHSPSPPSTSPVAASPASFSGDSSGFTPVPFITPRSSPSPPPVRIIWPLQPPPKCDEACQTDESSFFREEPLPSKWDWDALHTQSKRTEYVPKRYFHGDDAMVRSLFEEVIVPKFSENVKKTMQLFPAPIVEAIEKRLHGQISAILGSDARCLAFKTRCRISNSRYGILTHHLADDWDAEMNKYQKLKLSSYHDRVAPYDMPRLAFLLRLQQLIVTGFGLQEVSQGRQRVSQA